MKSAKKAAPKKRVRFLAPYRGEDGQWFVRITTVKGRCVGDLGEGYSTRGSAKRAADAMADCTFVVVDP